MKNFFKILCLGSLVILLNHLSIAQINLPNKGATLVNDFANFLSVDEKNALENKLVAFDKATSNQIAIVTIESLNGASIEDYAYNLSKKWQIGNAQKDNGVLIIVSKADRKSRIEVGKGLEGAIPDVIASEILRENIQSNFRQGFFYKGLDEAANNLIAASKNEYQGKENYYDNQDGGGTMLIVLIVFIGLFLLFMMVARSRNRKYYMSRGGHRGWNDPWIGGGPFIGTGGGFFDGGGSSGGGGFSGFGGFGGGDFGGGGASGDW
jgi:uncharacterized protein